MRRRTSLATFSAGRIAGIPIRVHWSWPLITLALIGALGDIYAREPGVAAPWLVAAAAALLLSLSLLLHELAHALVARRLGMRVHSIALFALGGVTEIADDRVTAPRELAVALAGPAVSLTLAVAATLAWWLQAGPPALAAQLALANWALTIFNLLPGHPLDGGRALKAVIWFLTDHELPASRTAAQAARGVGLGLVGLGISYTLLTGDALNAAWMLVVGMFLWLNAMDGYRRLALLHTLRGVITADLMRRAVRTVAPDLPLDQFMAQFVSAAAIHACPVAAAGAPQTLLGMLSLRDVRRFALGRWSSVTVAEAMTPASRVRAISSELPAAEALRALAESGEDLLPVVDDGVLSGVLWRSDVVAFIQRRLSR